MEEIKIFKIIWGLMDLFSNSLSHSNLINGNQISITICNKEIKIIPTLEYLMQGCRTIMFHKVILKDHKFGINSHNK